MPDRNKSWFCYLPVTPEAQDWGLYVLDAGYTLIPPHTPYPPHQHPEDHHFRWELGRTLDSYTLVYITRGGGVFDSVRGGEQRISAGDLFILFPGEWHRYRPDAETGWDEHWVEFDGEQARRIMSHTGFTPRKPVIQVGEDDELLRLFLEIAEATETQPYGFEHVIAAKTSQIVACALADLRRGEFADRENEKLIRRARAYLIEHMDTPVDYRELACMLGLSYSAFRRLFKQFTGLPPGRYQRALRIRRAGDMLRRTRLPIGEIAERLGFESIYYFSRVFKKETGRAPSECRE
ncbi:helix-turn-helix domain-containing protein [Kiritimatiella glycovorans]|uniref:AraC family transcriptional regulator n=1 Tax=Kiritimatiella glycovorans TaxID=1307763 RepID=A0A0G3EGG5_9BACT|nr:AraC family transcriptional regulator [Kiritimatiella glycovorans]AKJ65561.1 AraC family transcriptional regulator [Kiritimatiella glycovorans]